MELSGPVIIGIINLIIIILVGAFNWFSHNKIVYNDLKHLSTDVKEIKDEQVCMKKQVTTLSEDVGYLKGKLDAPLTVRKRKILK
jgi:hypothetical protein